MNMRVCIDCRKPISGRTDKKFCGDGCRSAYHNRLNNGDAKPVRIINGILIKNRKIIINLLKRQNAISVSEITLKELGFDFEHCTQNKTINDNKTVNFCYEFMYYKRPKNMFNIERIEMEE